MVTRHTCKPKRAGIWVSALLLVLLSPPMLFAEKPVTAASTDQCADQYILALADAGQIKGLSKAAIDSHSFYRDRALGQETINGSVEELLMLEPDLVVWSWNGSPKTAAILERADIGVLPLGFASDPDAIFSNLRSVGRALNKPKAAAGLLAAYKARLKRLETASRSGLKALYITPGAATAGQGTFVDYVIKLAGFDTVAEGMGITGWRTIPMEELILNPPDVIIGSFFDLKSAHQSDWRITRHPRLNKMMDTIPTILVPSKFFACNAFFFVDGAEYIRREAVAMGLIAPTGAADGR